MSEVKKELLFLGELRKPTGGDQEWFPPFCYELIEKMSEHYEIKILEREVIRGAFHYEVDGIESNVVLFPNSCLFIDMENNTALSFTTFWDDVRVTDNIIRPLKDFKVDIYFGHYYHKNIEHTNLFLSGRGIDDENYNLYPWTFRPGNWIDHKYEYPYNPKNEDLFFQGRIIPKHRDFIQIINSKKLDGFNLNIDEGPKGFLGYHDYHRTTSESLACLSAPGVKDMCYRDIELFGRGIPVLRTRFFAELEFEIPDDIYIPIDYKHETFPRNGMPKDHVKLSEDVIYTWNEVKNDKEYLKKIGNRAKEFHNDHFTNEVTISTTIKKIKEYFE